MPAERTLTLDTTMMEPFEIGAQIDALLAFPAPTEDERRLTVADAICARVVAITVEQFPDRTQELRARYPHYALRRNRTSLASLRRRRRIGQQTGYIAKTFLKEAMEGAPLGLAAGTRRSIPGLASHVLERHPGDDDGAHAISVEGFVRKKWRHWRPVAHLSSAYVVTALRSEVVGDVGFDLHDLDHHRAIVALANEHARHLRANSLVPWAKDRLIDLVWIE